MKRILLAAVAVGLAIGPAMAQETCASKAVDKNNKPLAGAPDGKRDHPCTTASPLPRARICRFQGMLPFSTMSSSACQSRNVSIERQKPSCL